MIKNLVVAVFSIALIITDLTGVAAQTQAKAETVNWTYKTENYKLELALKIANGKLDSYAIDVYRLTRGGTSANECGTLIERRSSANVVWKDTGNITRASGEDESGIPVDVVIEIRKNGFFVKSNFCENVGIPNILLTKKGKSYTRRIIR